MRSLLICALLPLGSGVAEASEADFAAVTAACESPTKIDEQVYYCSENTQAVASATRCRDALKRMWDNAPRDVNPEFAGLFKANDGKQQLNFRDSHRDYKTAMDKLAKLVNLTEDKADLIAQYPLVMADYPGAADDHSLSAPCYNDQVDKIQDLVDEMDRMILNGQGAFDGADQLRGISVARDVTIDSTPGVSLARNVAATSAPALNYDPAYPPFTGVPYNRVSDVTGVAQQREKDALGEFRLRGQLTGP